jgi:hypothetical protein
MVGIRGASIADPQLEQNRASGETSAPHAGQAGTTDWPHWAQNRASSASSVAQFGQARDTSEVYGRYE